MINVTALTSASGAAGYLTQDNYYLEKGQAQAQFYGQGAQSLNLTDQVVTSKNLTALLKGHLPDGQQVGHPDKHRPGWDATFSAPKSVSIQALVAGDDRINAAHDAAVKVALDHYEKHLTTRQRVNGKIEKQLTLSMVAATFQHQTSRNLDPQLHTHAVVMNLTQGQQGQWRSVSSESLYRLQRTLDQIYKTELEARLNQLGYATQKTEQGFEIKSIPENIREAFSSRSAQVEAELAKYQLTRAESTAEQRQIATLKTRQAKPAQQNLTHLQQSWQKMAKHLNWQPEPIPNAHPAQSIHQPHSQKTIAPNLIERVQHTLAVLTEKDAVVSEMAIYRHLNGTDQAAVSQQQLKDTLNHLKAQGQIHTRLLTTFDRATRLNLTQAAVVTEQGRQLEKQMLHLAQQMNAPSKPSWLGKISPTLEKLALNSGYFKGNAITSPKAAAKQIDTQIALAAEKGHHWTAEQRQAAIGILSHRGGLTQLQGYAGTAKTSSVLSAIRDIAKKEGYTIIAIAPSHAASQQLQKEIKADQALTTSGYLTKMQSGQHQKTLQTQKVLIIHDEAGLASSQQMKDLLHQAQKHHHRLLNAGDRYQKSSIGAGSAFGQLIDAKVPTYTLTTLFRQKDPTLKQAVEHSLPKAPNIQQAMRLLSQKGQILQIKSLNERIDTLAKHYTQLSPQQRQHTLLIDPTRKGVDALNTAIRAQLQAKNELPQNQLTLKTLHTQDIAKADLEKGAVGAVFKIGQIITLNSQALKNQDKALTKGSQWQITAFNRQDNTLQVRSLNPSSNAIKNSKPNHNASQNPNAYKTLSGTLLAKTHASVAELRETPIAIGEQLRFSASDPSKGLLTNEAVTLTQIDPKTKEITLTKTNGETLTLKTDQPLNLDYNYAKTTFSAQGLTAQKVLYHAQSTSTNLMNQRDFYVGLSRATHEITVVTDSKRDLTDLIEKSTGEKMTALEKESELPSVPHQSQGLEEGRPQESVHEHTQESIQASQEKDSSESMDTGQSTEIAESSIDREESSESPSENTTERSEDHAPEIEHD